MENDAKHLGFSRIDTPHGLAKRRILKSYLSSYFARGIEGVKYDRNRWSKYSSTYAVAYVDGFSFRGEYTSEAPITRFRISQPGESASDDIAYMGSPIIAFDRALDILKNAKEQRAEQFDFSIFQTCHFIFNDFKKDNVTNLFKLTQRVLKRYGWKNFDENSKYFQELKEFSFVDVFEIQSNLSKIKQSNILTYEYFDPDIFETYGKLWTIRLTFINDQFTNCPCPIAEKVFTFIDPCGIKEIPLEVIDRFLGPGKEVFINLMVSTIRRVSANNVAEKAICKLFGSEEAAEAIKELSNSKCKEAFKKYVAIYEKQIQTLCRTDAPNSVHFCFSKGKLDKECGDIFFMVFCNFDQDLKSMKNMKDAMMINCQTAEDGLRHTDYYFFNDIQVELGRKTSDEVEANEILAKFTGKIVTLGEVKLWIVYKSPFTFHSRALGLLEKNMKLYVTGAPHNRRRGNFDAKTLDPTQCFGSNNWMLQFS